MKGREDCSGSLTVPGRERIFLEVTGSLGDFVAVALIPVQSEYTYEDRMPMPLLCELCDHARANTSENVKGKGSDYFFLTALVEGNMGGEPGDPWVLGIFTSKDNAIETAREYFDISTSGFEEEKFKESTDSDVAVDNSSSIGDYGTLFHKEDSGGAMPVSLRTKSRSINRTTNL